MKVNYAYHCKREQSAHKARHLQRSSSMEEVRHGNPAECERDTHIEGRGHPGLKEASKKPGVQSRREKGCIDDAFDQDQKNQDADTEEAARPCALGCLAIEPLTGLEAGQLFLAGSSNVGETTNRCVLFTEQRARLALKLLVSLPRTIHFRGDVPAAEVAAQDVHPEPGPIHVLLPLALDSLNYGRLRA